MEAIERAALGYGIVIKGSGSQEFNGGSGKVHHKSLRLKKVYNSKVRGSAISIISLSQRGLLMSYVL
jgi:hypothetical protein